jgi:hypothetical protein
LFYFTFDLTSTKTRYNLKTGENQSKGKGMTIQKQGLHKDVATIFNGVWNPKVDNFQQFLDWPAAGFNNNNRTVVILDPAPNKNKPARSARIDTRAPWYNFLSPKARRERKRLLSISRHLIINVQSRTS